MPNLSLGIAEDLLSMYTLDRTWQVTDNITCHFHSSTGQAKAEGSAHFRDEESEAQGS